MAYFRIGTSETRNQVGSRAAKGETLEEAIEEAIQYSRARHVKMSWLTEVNGGKMGQPIAAFIKGEQVEL